MILKHKVNGRNIHTYDGIWLFVSFTADEFMNSFVTSSSSLFKSLYLQFLIRILLYFHSIAMGNNNSIADNTAHHLETAPGKSMIEIRIIRMFYQLSQFIVRACF